MKITIYCLCLSFLFLTSCSSHRPAFHGTNWEKHASPEVVGYNSQKLRDLTQYLEKESNTSGLLVIQKGKVLYEYGDIQQVSYIASCRKSVLSMLYGKYVDNGTIDLSETIGNLGITEKDGLLPIEKKATVDHIINSRSGVFHVASNGGYDKNNFLERGSVQPGEYFVYNNWDFNVAGHLFEQYTKRSVYEELELQFARPLGFQDWNIKNQRKYGKKKNSQYKAYHIYVSTRDMAKLGQLMLNKGAWNGQQLISKEWVKKTTTTVTPHSTILKRSGGQNPEHPYFSYAYMWWLIDQFRDNPNFEGAFMASGYGGQFILVIPKLEMVIAHKTKLNLLTKIGLTYKSTPDWLFWKVVDEIAAAKN